MQLTKVNIDNTKNGSNEYIKAIHNRNFAKELYDNGQLDINYDQILELSDSVKSPVVMFLPETRYQAQVLDCSIGHIEFNPEELVFLAEDKFIIANGYYDELPVIFSKLHRHNLEDIENFDFYIGVSGYEADAKVKSDIEKYKQLEKLLKETYCIDDGLLKEDLHKSDGTRIYTLTYHFYNEYGPLRRPRC